MGAARVGRRTSSSAAGMGAPDRSSAGRAPAHGPSERTARVREPFRPRRPLHGRAGERLLRYGAAARRSCSSCQSGVGAGTMSSLKYHQKNPPTNRGASTLIV